MKWEGEKRFRIGGPLILGGEVTSGVGTSKEWKEKPVNRDVNDGTGGAYLCTGKLSMDGG